jgi:hypothetical protein
VSADDLNLAAPIRTALIDALSISGELADWRGEPAVFTRRPIPGDATYPLIIVSPDIAVTDEDALKTRRPIVLRDVTIYGEQPDQYRTVEALGYRVRLLFHRQRFSIAVPGYHVVDIRCSGPMVAPADDLDHLARLVTLRVRLEDLAT